MDSSPRLTAPQAAARLGVKVETLYAYVSRGRLTRTRTAEGSFFDPLEIEEFARAHGSRTRAHPPASTGAPLMVLDTDIALIEDDELYFRGRPAVDLARAHGFEAVVGWLLGGRLVDAEAFALDDDALAAVRRLVAALPASASLLHRHEVAVLALASSDPLRDDPAVDNLVRTGIRTIAGAAAAATECGPSRDDDAAHPTIAERLAAGWTPPSAAMHLAPILDAALVLLVDHDLAVSTLAARAAASARASGYAVVTAGLGALDSPLHGRASLAAARLITAVVTGTPAAEALAEAVATGDRGVPGFGQFLYRGIDPRAAALLERLRDEPVAEAVVAAVDALRLEVATRLRRFPNIDLALGAVIAAFDLRPDAGTALFAIARSAGWIVHAVDEYGQRPLRLRPQGRYVEREPVGEPDAARP